MKFKREKIGSLSVNVTDGEHGSVINDIEGNFYLLSNKNIKNGSVVYDKNDRKISEESFRKINKRTKLEKDDVIIATVGSIGRSAIIQDEALCYDFQRSVGIIKADKSKLLPQFLHYYIQLEYVQKRLVHLSKGGVQKCLFISDLRDIDIDIPEDFNYQKKIAKVLSDLDAKIELNNKINSELESIAKLIYDYWFVQFDFPDENGKPYKSSGGEMVYNEELKREIPEGWEVGVFNDVLDDLQSGNRPKGGIKNIDNGIPSIGAENILSIGKYNYGSEKVIPQEFYNEMTKGIVESGDVLMYKDGASLGRVSMFKNGFPYEKCCINSHAFILRSNEKITQNYLYFWLDQDFMKEIIRRVGMRAAQPGINQVNVNELVILIPDASVIEKFESQITSSIDKIFANSVQNRKLAELRDWLLPMLMNGQVTVN